MLKRFEVEDLCVAVCAVAEEVGEGEGVVVDLRCFSVFIQMLYELIEVWIWWCVDVQLGNLFRLKCSVAKHAIPIARHKPIQRIADHAEFVQFVEKMLWLFGVGD